MHFVVEKIGEIGLIFSEIWENVIMAKMYYIPIYLKCGICVGYFAFYDFMWDTCGIDIFIVRICMWDKCGIGEKVKVF